MGAPEKDLFGFMLLELGIPRLRDAVRTGEVVELVDAEDLTNYCRVAAIRWSGLPDGETAGRLAAAFAHMLANVLSGDGPDYAEVDGEPHIRTPDGELRKVTAEMVQHWEWMLAILSDEGTARRLLDVVPAHCRLAADKPVDSAFAEQFRGIVEGP